MARNTNTITHAKGPKDRKHNLILHVLRVLQLFSALISLIVFSVRLAKIIRLTHRASRSNGAVEGILAAAVLYTIIASFLQICLRAGASQITRLLLIVFDVLFVGAFIAVAILTSPKRHGSSGPCNSRSAKFIDNYGPSAANCNLPWGTFILAIFSTVLHAITTAYHAARQHHREKRDHLPTSKDAQYDGINSNHSHGNGVNGNHNIV